MIKILPKGSIVFFLLWIFFFSVSSFLEAKPKNEKAPRERVTGKQWNVEMKYVEPGMDLFNPVFSPDGKGMAFVHKGHVPDGGEAENMDIEQTDRMMKEVRKKNRETHFEDPQVFIFDEGFKNKKMIGTGWAPCFSPDGRRLAFVQQVKSLAGLRTLAATMEGNSIALYDRKTAKTKVLATPQNGDFTKPFFSGDGNQVLYLSSIAVNGAYPGPIGLEKINLKSGDKSFLVKPRKALTQPVLVDGYSISNGEVFTTLQIPAEFSFGFVQAYSYDLINASQKEKVIYSWGKQMDETREFTPVFHAFSNRTVLVDDKGWKLMNIDTGKIVARPEGKNDLIYGVISPDGKKIVGHKRDYQKDAQGVFLMEIGNPTEEKILDLDSGDEVREMIWSPDSRKIAIAVSRSDFHDEIVIIKKRN